MATWDDVRRIALALPDVEELRATGHNGGLGFRVNNKLVAWERPLRASDRTALGDTAPSGEILGVRTPNLEAKETILAEEPDACFTIPHFNGYPAVLVRLDAADEPLLTELITEAWLVRAPKRVVATWRAEHPNL